MIKRTRSESEKVKKVLANTKYEHLQCRASRRHQFGVPTLDVERSPGRKPMIVIHHCPECGTKRFDTYIVRISKNFTFQVIEFASRSYERPEGYSQTADVPNITGLEYLSEYFLRLFTMTSEG